MKDKKKTLGKSLNISPLVYYYFSFKLQKDIFDSEKEVFFNRIVL